MGVLAVTVILGALISATAQRELRVLWPCFSAIRCRTDPRRCRVCCVGIWCLVFHDLVVMSRLKLFWSVLYGLRFALAFWTLSRGRFCRLCDVVDPFLRWDGGRCRRRSLSFIAVTLIVLQAPTAYLKLFGRLKQFRQERATA